MKLTNCYSEKEKRLQKLGLKSFNNKELGSLARTIKEAWDEQELQDENIIIDALVQISEELGRRLENDR